MSLPARSSTAPADWAERVTWAGAGLSILALSFSLFLLFWLIAARTSSMAIDQPLSVLADGLGLHRGDELAEMGAVRLFRVYFPICPRASGGGLVLWALSTGVQGPFDRNGASLRDVLESGHLRRLLGSIWAIRWNESLSINALSWENLGRPSGGAMAGQGVPLTHVRGSWGAHETKADSSSSQIACPGWFTLDSCSPTEAFHSRLAGHCRFAAGGPRQPKVAHDG